mgnify:CR=1 FL=1
MAASQLTGLLPTSTAGKVHRPKGKKDAKASKKDRARAKPSAPAELDPELVKEFDLDNYDDDDEEEQEGDQAKNILRMFGGVRGLQYYKDNSEDPYITLPDEVGPVRLKGHPRADG